jgi:colanic acid/amylovoran biosynthesis protein
MSSRLRSTLHQTALLLLWKLVRGLVRPVVPSPAAGALILPADAVTLVGSKGDEAMTCAVVDWLRSDRGCTTVTVGCAGPVAERAAVALGWQPTPIWGGVLMPLVLWRRWRREPPAAAVIVGADVMDGYYSPVESMRRLIAADLLARGGVPTLFTGFSFSDAQGRLLRHAFRDVHPGVGYNLRDPVSKARFERFCGRAGRLVADAAFLLRPQDDPGCAAPRDWMRMQHAAGRIVVAVNLHPLLFKGPEAAAQTDRLEAALAGALSGLSGQRPVSWLLLPHDDRAAIGDVEGLKRLAGRLSNGAGHSFLVPHPPSAAAIKGLVAHADGVVTGRMHLAIAALGGGVPILAFAYQAKFAGLLRHFALPDWLLIDPAAAIDDAALVRQRLERFLEQIGPLRSAVQAALPAVKALAHSTFEVPG